MRRILWRPLCYWPVVARDWMRQWQLTLRCIEQEEEVIELRKVQDEIAQNEMAKERGQQRRQRNYAESG